MSYFVQTLPSKTPVLLCHHTSVDNVVNMLRGDTKSVCFWLKNNLDKNDKQELRMGIALMETVRDYLQSIGSQSLLDQLTDFENSYSLSFTEGEVNDHMLKEYGKVRLELDLRQFREERLMKCEYYDEADVDKLASVYINDIKSLVNVSSSSPDAQKIDKYLRYITMVNDITEKISTIKHRSGWEREGEWRMVLFKQKNDPRFFVPSDGEPRLRINIPISFLKGVTLFYDSENKTEMNRMRSYLKSWKRWNEVRSFNVVMRKFMVGEE